MHSWKGGSNTRRNFAGTVAIGFAAAVVLMAQAVDSANDAFQRGAVLRRAAKCSAAIPYLTAGADADPRAYLLLGRCYFDMERYTEAARALDHFRPQTPESIVFLAQVMEKADQTEAAVARLVDYLHEHSDEPAVHAALGDIYSRLGRSSSAEDEFRLARAANPDEPGLFIAAGRQAEANSQWAAAISEYEKVQDTAPDNSIMLRGMGRAYSKLGDCERAAASWHRALQLAPDDFALALPLAECYAKLQSWAEVLSTLQTGTRQEAASEDATALVCAAYGAVGDRARAEPYLRQVQAAAPTNLRAQINLSDLLYDAGKKEEARAQYQTALKLNPDLPRVSERLGDMAQDSGNSAEARTYFEMSAKSKNATDGVRMKLVRICYSKKDQECALAGLEKITTPALVQEGKVMRADIAFQRQQWDIGGSLATEMLTDNPKNLLLLRIAGMVAAKQNRPADAAQFYERAIVVAPDDKDLRYSLAELYTNEETLKGMPRAIEVLNDFIQKHERDAVSYLMLANVYRLQGDFVNAETNFTRGFDLLARPVPEQLSWAFSNHAKMFFEQKKYDDAFAAFTDATAVNKNDSDAWFNLALSALKLGRIDDVNAARQRLVELNSPDVPQVDEYIRASQSAKKRK